MKDEIIFTPFYSVFLALCEKEKISPTEAAKRAGISSGAPTAWKKKGAVPRPEQLKKLCSLFNVSENEMMGYSVQKETPPETQEAIDPATKELYAIIDRLSGPKLDLLLEKARELEKF